MDWRSFSDIPLGVTNDDLPLGVTNDDPDMHFVCYVAFYYSDVLHETVGYLCSFIDSQVFDGAFNTELFVCRCRIL